MSLYSVKLTFIGDCAQESLEDDFMIIFNEKAPKDVAEYCFVHNHDELKGEIEIGSTLTIDGVVYPITAVGSLVNENLANLGHITIRFDGELTPEFNGSLHVFGDKPSTLQIGSTITFK